MITLPGYRIIEQIYSGSRTEVYRAISESDQKSVVIKLLLSEYPTFNELVQFRNQYTIAKNIDLAGIVKPIALINYRNSFALVMEDIGGVSLTEYTANTGHLDNSESIDAEVPLPQAAPIPLEEFLSLAIQIVHALEGLYYHRIIHKDIKPQNILINPETKQIKLIDFSISSLLPRENQEIQNPNILEGTLAYMSPEQTGRMNRGIDYRTDFYSLGVTFYELLTGQLPFQSPDPMELVYCHIAKIPTLPIELIPTIPVMVNDIVLKLMAKNAELRYQSAFGLRYDLENCLQQLQEKGSISQFPIATKDISERFVIPEKLYGRETEVATLLSAFERVANPPMLPIIQEKHRGVEMILVAGFSGIGKTAVVNEVHKPIVRQRGYFIKGKFDQFQRDIPFSAWVLAFQNLMRQFLTKNAADIQKWQVKILNALGENGQVIIDVIPELEHLIGKQQKAPELTGIAAQNRFNLLFQNFIRVFSTKEHPLVIFLDDLQWADSASLKLMQLLMSETDTRYLLLMGAYRDNEVFPTHPLMLTLDEIRKESAIVNQITLAPLDQPALNRLIADTLSCPSARAIPLTEMVFTKTKGNPFFATQFLKSLHEDGLITFDLNSGYWQCDIAQVRALSLTDDVVEFMAIQLQKLPVHTQEVLKLAACIGNQFDLVTLAIVHEKSQVDTAADLWKALQEGLVIPISEVYKFFQDLESFEVTETSDLLVPYKFLHDRVQQAAYSLIPEQKKQSTHFKIGQLLLRNTLEEEREEKIFDVVNQLNIGKELIADQTEQDELAQLNLIAGRKAKDSTAYAAAKKYLTVGLDLLSIDSWQNQYGLTLAIYELATETAYLNGDFEEMEKWAEVVLQQAKTLLDKVKVYEVKITAYASQNRLREGIEIGLQALKLLGINFPEHPSQLDIQHGLDEVTLSLTRKNLLVSIDLPEMTDPQKLAMMSILSSLFAPVYVSAPELMPLLVLEKVKLSIQYGNSPWSAFAYGVYGVILCGVIGDIESGYQFGKLALSLLDKFNAKAIQARTLDMVEGFVIHWKDHAQKLMEPMRWGYQCGVESGEFEWAGYTAFKICQYSLFIGKELTSLEREMAFWSQDLARLQQKMGVNLVEVTHQTALNLIGQSENACLLVGEAIDEEQLLPIYLADNNGYGLHYFYLNKLILCYLFGEFDLAVTYANHAGKYLGTVTAALAVPVFHLYDSLAQLMLHPHVAESEQLSILEKIAAHQEKMKIWADYAPMNYLHKFHLVEAEKYRILGQNMEAMDYYDCAIAGAKENEYINEEALANELAAKFYIAWGKEKIAQVYLTDAYYAYARWGAKAKVEDLEKRYPQLLSPILNQKKSLKTGDTIAQMMTETVATTNSDVSDSLDLATVIKASQALSGEIKLDKLLSTLMQVAIENAGASKGVLIWEREENLVIEAVGISSTSEITVLQSIPLETSNDVPKSLINYVAKTQELLIYNNFPQESQNLNDPYIIQHHPKSVLCLPIQNQGKAIALLYLENNLTEGAFTPARLEVLKVLSSQAAISIANSQLYAQVKENEKLLAEYNRTLEIQVSDRTQELQQSEARFRQLYEQSADAILLLDGEIFIDCNPAAVNMMRCSNKKQLLSLHPSQLSPQIQPDGTPSFEKANEIIAMAFERDSHRFEWMHRRVDGEDFWVEVLLTVIPLNGKKILHTVWREIGDRKQAEAALYQKNKELRDTLQQLKTTQEELIQSAKMAALGQLIAGIAHEVNTPLGAIRSSAGNISKFLDQTLEQLPTLFQSLSPEHLADFLALLQRSLQQESTLSTREERKFKRALRQQLEAEEIHNVDTVADTLVTMGIYNEIELFSPLLKRPDSSHILDIAYKISELKRGAANINTATDRASKVVFALKTYAHYDQSSQMTIANLIEGIETILTLYQSQLKQGVEVIRNYDSLPPLLCYPDELNQVWTNLVHNSLQAMDYRGTLTIEVTTIEIEQQAKISITDSGKGIPQEIQTKIFEPFFTTKAPGEGSGLGLDIVKKIMEKHNGKVTVESQPGRTTFNVFLPIQSIQETQDV